MMRKYPKSHVNAQTSFYLRNGRSLCKVKQRIHGYPKHRSFLVCSSCFEAQHKQLSKREKIILSLLPEIKKIERVYDDVISDIQSSSESENPFFSNFDDDEKEVLSFWETIRKVRTTTKILWFLCILLVIACIFGLIELRNIFMVPDIQWKNNRIEYGDTSAVVYEVKDNISYSVTPIDYFSLGKQKITISYEIDGEIQKESQFIEVVDTQAPKISFYTPLVSTIIGNTPDYNKMHIECIDPVDGPVSYFIEPVDVNQIGEHITTLTAEDINGNQTTEQITVVVKGVGDENSVVQYQKQRQALLDEYKEKIELEKKEEEARKRKEKEERERQALIESLGVSHLSESVLQWALDVHKINKELWDTQYDALVLAVIQIESGGTACDLMQASESQGGSAAGHSCGVFKDENEALRAGIPVLKNAMETAGVRHAKDYERIAYALQGYNFGPRYFQEYDRYSLTNAKEFSEIMKKEKGWDVYGAPGYPEYVFKYYNPSYVFQNKEEPKLEIPEPTPQPDVEPPTTPEVDTDTTEPSVPENPQQEESESDGNSSDDPIQDMIEAN